MKKFDIQEEKVLILISSLMVWNNTPPNLKEMKDGKLVEEVDPNAEVDEQEAAADEGDKADEKVSNHDDSQSRID